MRLSEEERSIIKNVFNEIFFGGKLYLFGSRTDDTKKGGDIDLLILSDVKYDINLLLRFGTELKKQLGDRKIDILNHENNDTSAFHKLIMMDAQEL